MALQLETSHVFTASPRLLWNAISVQVAARKTGPNLQLIGRAPIGFQLKHAIKGQQHWPTNVVCSLDLFRRPFTPRSHRSLGIQPININHVAIDQGALVDSYVIPMHN